MGFIYKITNKINGKVYIGQTTTDIESRWNKHKYACYNPNSDTYNTKFYRGIRKYGFNNFTVELVEQCNDSELNDKEQYWIQFYNSYSKGYNSTIGGEGGTKYSTQDIVNLWNQGYSCSEIAKKMNMGKTGSRKVVIPRLKAVGLYSIQEMQKRMKKDSQKKYSKPILQFDLNGNLIKKYHSVNEAARILKYAGSGISNAARGISKQYNGYIWKYENDKNPLIIPRMVSQYDLNNHLIQQYKTVTDAARNLNCKAGSIYHALNGRCKTAHGYKWKYENEIE